jgi:hypothetical protein
MAVATAVRSVAALAHDLRDTIAGPDQLGQRLIIRAHSAVPDRLDIAKMTHVQSEFRSPPEYLRDSAVSAESETDSEVALASRKRYVATQVVIRPRTSFGHTQSIPHKGNDAMDRYNKAHRIPLRDK